MKEFKDLGISEPETGMIGDKINIDRILNRPIVVHSFKVEDSKYKKRGNEKCLYLQIEVGEEKRVVFTGSASLIEMIQKVPAGAFPFKVTITKSNNRLLFT